MVRERLPRLLTSLPDPPARKVEEQDEELDESDVVWSSFGDETQSLTPTTTSSVTATSYSLSSILHPFSSSPSAGLSAALFSPDSPKSVQRKTTSSPVSMISSRSSDGATGPYYGRKYHQSAPVNVPVWPGRRRGGSFGLDEVDGDDEGFQDDEGMVPPHEIVARSQRTTVFSVMEGAGRTLKGRDLTTVRNAVFQKTGFLQ